MPQMNKGGKFIFGKSIVRNDGVLQFPEQAIREYDITDDGKIVLTDDMMAFFKIEPEIKLLSIRSSDIAFTMGAYGRLVEKSMKHENKILVY